LTDAEITAIEGLQREYSSFIFGMNPTTEAFITNDSDEVRNCFTISFTNKLFYVINITWIMQQQMFSMANGITLSFQFFCLDI
jgi:hypothetical protein